jgi:hypothetical protein
MPCSQHGSKPCTPVIEYLTTCNGSSNGQKKLLNPRSKSDKVERATVQTIFENSITAVSRPVLEVRVSIINAQASDDTVASFIRLGDTI